MTKFRDLDSYEKTAAIGFIFILVLMSFICFLNSACIGEPDPEPVTYENAEPPKFVDIQGERVRLSDIQGFTVMEFSIASRRPDNDKMYILRLYGVAHEFAYSDREEAEDVGIYICMLKGEGL